MFSSLDHTMFACFMMLASPNLSLCLRKICNPQFKSFWVVCGWSAAAETHDWGSQEGKTEANCQELYDCAVVGSSLMTVQQAFEKHSCTGACSTCTGHHQWNKGCMLNFSNSLVIFVSSRAHGVGSKWSSVVSSLRGRMGWLPLRRNCSLKPSSPESTCSDV